MTVGLLRSTILLPEEAVSWPRDTLRAALLHEAAHARRHDVLATGVARVACALHWFNPLVWIAASWLRRDGELACDEAVLEGEKRLILVADTDRRLLDLAEDLLAVDDYRVDRADSAGMTLEKLRFRRPHLLVLDLQMTDESRGVPLIERIHALFPRDRFPIVGLSSNTETDPVRVTRLGVDRFITKPFSLSLLRSVVKELLDTYTPATN